MFGPASQSARGDAPVEAVPPFSRGVRILRRPRPTGASLPGVALLTAVAAGALLVVLVLVSLVEHRMYSGRVLPGVHVDGISAAGHREVTVYDDVTRLGLSLAQSPVRVRIGKQELTAGPSLLDLTVDARATASDAVHAGRGGNFIGQALDTALRRVRSEHVGLRVVYDENRLEGLLDGWSAATDNGEVEGGLRFDGDHVVPIRPHAGSGIVRAPARAALERMLATARRPVVTLPVGTIRPRVGSTAVDAAAARARALLTGSHSIVIGTTTVPLTPRQLASAMGTRISGHHLDVTIDPDRLHSALATALTALETPPVDATFAVTEQNTVNVVPSRDGHEIDMAGVARAILRGERRIVAPLRDVTPHRDTKWATALGIVRQVSSFTTDYPAGQTRVLNIHRGADLLNNTIVEPGKVFSLNQTIGPRTKARGFVTAPVFAQGEFFDDYGGGVSQLATTTYNAAFFSGFQDVTHQPHTIYISRYPPGREATVNYGAIDLQFRDDTPHGILIRAYYGDTSVTVAMYGDTDGRTAREDNRTTSNPVAVTDQLVECPAPKTIDPDDACATLPAGQQEQISTGDAGFDVAFDRVIDQPGKAERREHYTWHYTMLPNQILVGSGSASPTESTQPTTETSTDTATAP